MKTTVSILFLLTLFLYSCDEEVTTDEEEPERTSHLVTFVNLTASSGCLPTENLVSFVVSYRDIQVILDIEDDQEAYLTVLVEDGESINVVVKRVSDDVTLANADVAVRTSSRPKELENAVRLVSYCTPFNLIFENF